ncbi:TetR-like C-terminal domain-containing protein [Streptomyces sp. NPDC093089]|uniref:TetR-like C-terminal domain-containing protein n=1 Tax=Streptomyces sp. NPDC093089 TaxID=3366024 RepID=UPI0038152252
MLSGRAGRRSVTRRRASGRRGGCGRGLDRGELPAGADLELAADQVFGTFWYRLLVGHAPLDPAEAAHHADRVLDGLTGRTPPGPGQA